METGTLKLDFKGFKPDWLIVLWITLHIRGLSRGIGEFSVRVLGAAAAPAEEGSYNFV